MKDKNFIVMTHDEYMEVEGGVIPAFVGPLLKGAAALLSAVGGACNFHLFLESRVENAGYAMAYEAEMSRLMKEEQDSK